MTLYLVSAGEYSDYHVVAICSTREKAELVIATDTSKYSEFNDIKEYELDAVADMVAQGYKVFFVLFNDRGDVIETASNQRLPGSVTPNAMGAPSHRSLGDMPAGSIRIYDISARDSEHAVKIASEMRIKFLVTKEQEKAQK